MSNLIKVGILSYQSISNRGLNRYTLLLTLAVLCSANLNIIAQDETPTPNVSAYQLRQPTLEEYLAVLPKIEALPALENTDDSPFLPYQLVFTVIANEIETSYTDADYEILSLSTLQDAAIHLVGPLFGYANYLQSEVSWHRRVMSAWLREAQPDFSRQTEWQVGDYTIKVQPVDFDGDGIEDYAAELRYQLKQERDFDAFRGFFVIHSLAENPVRYEIVANGLPAFSIMCFPYTGCAGDGKSTDILDVTGDGHPEWIIQSSECGYGICGVDLGIFQWQTDEMVDISGWAQEGMFMSVPAGSSMPLDPPHGGWEIENLDDDAALEINQYEELTDNLDCHFSRETIFDWVEQSGEFTQTQTVTYDDSLWCDLRQGHEAIKSFEVDAAIAHYERFLETDPDPELEDVWTYVSLRLALAYGLSGDDEAASALIHNLKTQPIQNAIIATMVDAAQEVANEASATTIGVRLCTALNQDRGEIDYFGEDMQQLFQYGYLNDYGMSMNYAVGFGPEEFGCNLPLLFETTIAALDLAQPFASQLEDTGWHISNRTTLYLNQDEVDDEVLHIPALKQNIVRLSTRDDFIYYTDYGDPLVSENPDVKNTIWIFMQPDHKDALLFISYNSTLKCDENTSTFPGSIRLWTLDVPGVYGLNSQIQEVICQPQTIAQTLPLTSPDTVVILDSVKDQPLKYVWNEEFDNYEIDTSTSVGLDSRFKTCLSEYLNYCVRLDEPEKVLAFEKFMQDYVIDPPQPLFVSGLSYFKALALEELGRDEEALAEYVALYEGDPESPWHILAGLHLERN